MLGVQSSRGVNKEIIHLACLCGSHGIVRHGSRIGAVSAGDHINLEARTPQFELLDGGGAKGVACGEQRGLLLRLDKRCAELFGGRGLARAVEPDDGDDGRAARGLA